jgi:hypothetical protein
LAKAKTGKTSRPPRPRPRRAIRSRGTQNERHEPSLSESIVPLGRSGALGLALGLGSANNAPGKGQGLLVASNIPEPPPPATSVEDLFLKLSALSREADELANHVGDERAIALSHVLMAATFATGLGKRPDCEPEAWRRFGSAALGYLEEGYLGKEPTFERILPRSIADEGARFLVPTIQRFLVYLLSVATDPTAVVRGFAHMTASHIAYEVGVERFAQRLRALLRKQGVISARDATLVANAARLIEDKLNNTATNEWGERGCAEECCRAFLKAAGVDRHTRYRAISGQKEGQKKAGKKPR